MITAIRHNDAERKRPVDNAKELWFAAVDTPLGQLHAHGYGEVLHSLRFSDAEAKSRANVPNVCCIRENAATELLRSELAAYFSGKSADFSIAVDVAPYTQFCQKTWAALRAIPCGQTRSYSEQAAMMGLPRRYVRAVAGANGRNPLPVVIPCHRVIAATGALSGYACGVWRKQALLEHERRYFM